MSSDAGKILRQNVENYKRAIAYLDECGELTYEKFVEAVRLSGRNISEPELRRQWDQAHDVLSAPDHPGGTEFLRSTLRNTLMAAISEFEDVSWQLDVIEEGSSKKWWQFWKC